MKLSPSVRFEDAAGVGQIIDIPFADTLTVIEQGIHRAIAEAARLKPVNPRIEIHDVDTGRLLIRRSINFKEKSNGKA